ncbi:MAG: ZIP family metal transporter [Gammaproteobacteria bacterium]
MDHYTIIKLVSGIIIFCIAYGAGYVALRHSHQTLVHEHPSGEAFASGIFLGAAFFHMLPEAHHAFLETLGPLHYSYGNILCAATFISLFAIELVLQRWQQQPPYIALLLLCLLAIHSLSEGAAFGISQAWQNLFVIFLAIMAHKGSASYALVRQLQRYQKKHTHKYLLFFSTMTPLGILLGNSLLQFTTYQSSLLITACFYAIAAGSFLYIGTVHGSIKHMMQHRRITIKAFAMLCLGLAVMAFFD